MIQASRIALVVGLSFAAAARADVIISNFSSGVGTGTAFGGLASTLYKAFGFTMGGTSHTLDSVILSMNFAGLGTPKVSIWSGAAIPETELITLDNPPVLTGQTNFTFTAPGPFTLEAGQVYWVHVVAVPVSGGPTFLWDGSAPSILPTGPGAAPVAYIFNGNNSLFFNRLQVIGTPPPCYPNCNGVGGLTIADFACFQTRFVAQDPYADCNGVGGLTIADFACFQTRFVAGCP